MLFKRYKPHLANIKLYVLNNAITFISVLILLKCFALHTRAIKKYAHNMQVNARVHHTYMPIVLIYMLPPGAKPEISNAVGVKRDG